MEMEDLCTLLSHLANHEGVQNASTRSQSIEAPYSTRLFLLPELPQAANSPLPRSHAGPCVGPVVVLWSPEKPLVFLRLKISY